MSDRKLFPKQIAAPTRGTLAANEEIDLWQMSRILWSGKWWIVISAFVAVLMGAYYVFGIAESKYTSHAIVALDSREEQVVDLESVVSGLSGDQASINTEVEVLRSRGLIGKLVDALNLKQDQEFNTRLREPPNFSLDAIRLWVESNFSGPGMEESDLSDQALRDAVINNTLDAISISNVRQSYVFRISVVTNSAQKSALIANRLAELYILDQLEVKFKATQQATGWLTERVGELQVALENADAAVKEFSAGSALIDAEVLAALNRQIKDLRERVSDAEAVETRAKSRVATLQAAFATDEPAKIAEAARDQSLSRAFELLDTGGNAAQTSFDARFELIKARATLSLQRASNQKTAMQASILNLEQQVENQSADLVQLQQLQREAEASRLIYEYFLGRLKETSVQQGIHQADSRILSQAVVAQYPSAPRKAVILALAAMLGVLGSTVWVFLREMTQNNFRTAEDLTAMTGYVVLGQIPRIPARRRASVLKYLTDKPNSAAAEAIRNLRTSIMLSNLDHPPQVIMSTSAIPGEGKTTQSVALAQNFSRLGKSVLLIEGDIRRLVFNDYFDLPGEHSLLTVLAGEVSLAAAVVHAPELGADVLKGETSSTNAADIFSSDNFTALLGQARETYDVIIIDTPPVLVVPDARVVGQSVDATLLSVQWNATSRSQVQEALRLFEMVNLKVAGLVLSKIDAKGMKRYGYGNYGAYGAYGKSYYAN